MLLLFVHTIASQCLFFYCFVCSQNVVSFGNNHYIHVFVKAWCPIYPVFIAPQVWIITHDLWYTKHLYNMCTKLAQRLRRWPNIVQMLYKYFVFTGWLQRDDHDISANAVLMLAHRVRKLNQEWVNVWCVFGGWFSDNIVTVCYISHLSGPRMAHSYPRINHPESTHVITALQRHNKLCTARRTTSPSNIALSPKPSPPGQPFCCWTRLKGSLYLFIC